MAETDNTQDLALALAKKVHDSNKPSYFVEFPIKGTEQEVVVVVMKIHKSRARVVELFSERGGLNFVVKAAPGGRPTVRMIQTEIRVALLRELLRELALAFQRARVHDDGSLCFQEFGTSTRRSQFSADRLHLRLKEFGTITRRSCALLGFLEFCAERHRP